MEQSSARARPPVVGDTRKWAREHGHQFLLKDHDERISMPGTNALTMARVLRSATPILRLAFHSFASFFAGDTSGSGRAVVAVAAGFWHQEMGRHFELLLLVWRTEEQDFFFIGS
jgi:hypothetical protein